MKFMFLLLFLPIMSLQAQTEQDHFVLRGEVQGRDTGFIYLHYLNGQGKFINDTALVQNGMFTFSGMIREPTFAVLKNTRSWHTDNPNYTELFLEPGLITTEMTINQLKMAVITGSKTQTEWDSLKQIQQPILEAEQPFDSLLQISTEALAADGSNDSLINRDGAIRNQLHFFRKQLNQTDYHFISTHPASYISAYLLLYDLRYLPLDSCQSFYASLAVNVKSSQYGKLCRKEIERQQRGLPGTVAADFVIPELIGKQKHLLSSYHNSYVILDFWASWCVPCRQSIPHLRQLYQAYHAKGLEVIAISIKDDKEDWQAAVTKDSTGGWHHVLDDDTKDNNIASLYGIQGIPVKILIDKKGNIIGRYEGYDEKENDGELTKTLSALMPE